VKSIDLTVAHDGFLYKMEIVHIFHSGYFGAFQTVLDSYCCVELNIADREGQWILQLQMITGVRGTIVFFIVPKRDYRHTF